MESDGDAGKQAAWRCSLIPQWLCLVSHESVFIKQLSTPNRREPSLLIRMDVRICSSFGTLFRQRTYRSVSMNDSTEIHRRRRPIFGKVFLKVYFDCCQELLKQKQFRHIIAFPLWATFSYRSLRWPTKAKHEGHVCTVSWHVDEQNGIKQQPNIPPKRQMIAAISQVPPPTSYRTLVRISW